TTATMTMTATMTTHRTGLQIRTSRTNRRSRPTRGSPGRRSVVETSAGGEVRRGSLTVVGTGIDAASHLTPAARGAIEGADEVFYLLADPVAALRVEALNPRASSLDRFYGPTKARRETYSEVVETIVGAV